MWLLIINLLFYLLLRFEVANFEELKTVKGFLYAFVLKAELTQN